MLTSRKAVGWALIALVGCPGIVKGAERSFFSYDYWQVQYQRGSLLQSDERYVVGTGFQPYEFTVNRSALGLAGSISLTANLFATANYQDSRTGKEVQSSDDTISRGLDFDAQETALGLGAHWAMSDSMDMLVQLGIQRSRVTRHEISCYRCSEGGQWYERGSNVSAFTTRYISAGFRKMIPDEPGDPTDRIEIFGNLGYATEHSQRYGGGFYFDIGARFKLSDISSLAFKYRKSNEVGHNTGLEVAARFNF